VSIHVALNHVTHYRYDRRVGLSPQVVRLRPAPHCRTPIVSYSLRIEPGQHFINWQQDPFANHLARLVFPEKTTEFKVTVDLVAEMAVYNPFDFFLEPDAEHFPFAYAPELAHDLAPYLAKAPATPLFKQLVDSVSLDKRRTIDFLVDINQRLQRDIRYVIRMEPGVQTPERTLDHASGSCRDTGWLLVQLLRHLGLAARFVSGYLIQLKPDVKSLDGPSGSGSRLHRPARLVRGLPARRRLDRPGPHLGPDGRRRPHPRGLHARAQQRRAGVGRGGRKRGRVQPPHAGDARLRIAARHQALHRRPVAGHRGAGPPGRRGAEGRATCG
jgi:transglutaminase-like putative cysteine protease